jgi:hypothetical protein
VCFPQASNDGSEGKKFLFHLLMMGPALLGLSSSNKGLHRLENFVHPSHMSVDKMNVMEFQKPMIKFILVC